MFLKSNNKEFSDSNQILSVSNPQNTPKKNLFQIESVQLPFISNNSQKTNTISFNPVNKINFSTINQYEFKPKFFIAQDNKNSISNIQGISSFKFMTNKEQNAQNNLETN